MKKDLLLLLAVYLFFINNLLAQITEEHILTTGIQSPSEIEVIHADDNNVSDILVLNSFGSLNLILSNGDGTFSSANPISTDVINNFSLFDRDADGDTDILILKSGGELSWLENTQSGTFEVEHFIATLGFENSKVDFFDLDQDGDIDILGGFGSAVFWLENTGNDVYSDQDILSYSANGFLSAHPLDFDNDGDFDLLITNFTVGVRLLENEGNLDFSFHSSIGPNVLSSQFVDLDLDGDMDLLYTTDNTIVAWLRNNGNGSFSSITINSSASWPKACHAVDLDNDGDLDVLSGSTNDNKFAWYEKNANGDYGAQQVIDQDMDNPIGIVSGNFFGNGYMGAVVISDEESQVRGYKNNFGNGFTDQVVIAPPFLDPRNLHFLDINDDEIPDIVFKANTNHVYAAFGDCNGGFEYPVSIYTTTNSFWEIENISIADIDNDQDNDIFLIINSAQSDRISFVRFQNGTFGELEVIHFDDNTYLMAAEISGDEYVDLVGLRYGNMRYYPNQNGTFDSDNRVEIDGSSADNWGRAIYFVDLDNDGDKDVVRLYNDTGKVGFTENLGNGSFGEQVFIIDDDSYSNHMELHDADEDGDLDIFIDQGVPNEIVWFENTDDFQFSEQHTIPLDFFTYAIFDFIDLNQDGMKDLYLHTRTIGGSPQRKAFQLLALGDGNYGPHELIPLASDHFFLEQMICDMDGDGNEDILFTDLEQHRIAWYKVASQDSITDGLVYSVEANDSLSCYDDQSGFINIEYSLNVCNQYAINWWQPQLSGFELNNLDAGTYVFELSDTEGNITVDSVIIYAPSEFSISGGSTDTYSGQNIGAAWVSPTGGTAPYTYQWDDPLMSTTDSVSNLVPGDYSVIVTDANDCQQQMTFTIDLLNNINQVNDLAINIYPTLITDHTIYISTNQSYTTNVFFEILTIQGTSVKVIEKNELRSGDAIDTGNLSHGMYFLRIKIGQLEMLHKFIKH